MLFYFTLFTFIVLMYLINSALIAKDRWIVEILTIFVLILVSGTRIDIGGWDYSVYKTVFDSLPKIDVFILNISRVNELYTTYGHEIGFLFFNSLVKTLNFNFYGFTLINAFIFYSILYIGLKRYFKNFNFFLILFLYKLFFYNTFISMRQSMTLAIFFLALQFLEEKKFIKYMLLCFVSVLFHNASIILFPVYLLNFYKLDKKLFALINFIFAPLIIISFYNLSILNIFSFVLDFSISPVIKSKLMNFFFSNQSVSLSLLNSIEYFLITILVFINFDKLKKYNPRFELFVKLFLILLPMFTLFRNYEILTRLKDYFIFTYAILLSYILESVSIANRKIIICLIILVCALGYFRFILTFDNRDLLPYRSYLFTEIRIFGD